jgi:hypothetical protein
VQFLYTAEYTVKALNVGNKIGCGERIGLAEAICKVKIPIKKLLTEYRFLATLVSVI